MLNKILNWGIAILAGLMPLFFLPLTAEYYEFNKNSLLFLFTAALLILWLIDFLKNKELRFTRTPFDLGVILIVFALILGNIFASSNKIGALSVPGGTGTFLILALIYFLVSNNLRRPRLLINSIIASASLLALISIYQFIGLGELITQVDWLKVKSWTPFGNPLSLVGFLLVNLILLLPQLIKNWREKNKELPPALIWQSFISLVLIAGISVCAFQLFTSAKPMLLPYKAGWFIAIEAFKKQPLFGVGADNYLSAFGGGRPIWLNMTSFWSMRFNQSSNFYLQVLTTLGIIGLGSWIFLLLKIIQTLKKNEFLLPLGLLLFFFFFFPANLPLLVTFFLLLATAGKQLNLGEAKFPTKLGSQIVFGLGLLLAAGIIYGSGRLWLADFYFRKSLVALTQKKGNETYNWQIKAINLNPFQENYRLSYSQTNLALANSIATNAPVGGLSDRDRQNISQLVQQSIREAKVAVSLSPNKSINWENLAGLYRSMVNFAQGAEDWSTAAYKQAVRFDPTNPTLRISFGGFFHSLKKYDLAIEQFNLAVNLKPDYANAYYNLASAYKENNQLKEALTALERTKALTAADSNDAQKVNQEIRDLQARLPKEEASPSANKTPETLTQPATAPAKLKPPLQLPQETGPEIGSPSAQ